MNRARKASESYKDYKANLKTEQIAADRRVAGTYIWRGKQVDPFMSATRRGNQGTAVRSMAYNKDRRATPYVAENSNLAG